MGKVIDRLQATVQALDTLGNSLTAPAATAGGQGGAQGAQASKKGPNAVNVKLARFAAPPLPVESPREAATGRASGRQVGPPAAPPGEVRPPRETASGQASGRQVGPPPVPPGEIKGRSIPENSRQAPDAMAGPRSRHDIAMSAIRNIRA